MITTTNNITFYISVIFTEITKFLSSLYTTILEYQAIDCVIICIYVAPAIVVFVSFMNIANILDTDEDFERRRRRTPINLVYTYVIRSNGGIPVPFIVDLNDLTGLKMQTMFNGRQLSPHGLINGFYCTNPSVNDLGVLEVNVGTTRFNTAVAVNNGVYSRGLPITHVQGYTQY